MDSIFQKKLKKVFSPNSIAVIGASDSFEKLGYHVMKSLVLGGYRGCLYPVNPASERIWGLKAHRSILDIEKEVELAIIVVPAKKSLDVLFECGKKKVMGAVIISAGYKETEGDEGKYLEERMRELSEGLEIPIVGPNTFGFVNVTDKVNASFTYEFSLIKEGGTTIISQSGGFCHLIGFLAIEERMGVAKLVGLGNRVNLDFHHTVRYFLEEDSATKALVLYIEGMDEPRKLFNAISQSKAKKPIIAYKSAKNVKRDVASKFHTGSLAGNYKIWKGAFRQFGILEVADSEELIDIAKALEACPSMRGERVAVLSGQAGPGIIAADVLEKEGLKLANFSEVTQRKIDELLPPLAIRTNPVDMGPAWYSPKTILSILKVASDDENTDGILFLNMFASANLKLVKEMVRILRDLEPFNKPVIACLCAPPGIWDEEIKEIDGQKGIVVVPTPERAARTLANLYRIGSTGR